MGQTHLIYSFLFIDVFILPSFYTFECGSQKQTGARGWGGGLVSQALRNRNKFNLGSLR